ncbi:MAG: hypothetical protein LIV24_05540 [Eubacterium sp.]|nr:hypothetical protein [Eubacterium sp.]
MNTNHLSSESLSKSPDSSHVERKKYPWTARRIIALAGILLLILLYALTMVFALLKSPYAKGLLMGAIYCTIIIPVLLYAMTMVARLVRGKGVPKEDPSKDSKSGQPPRN